MGSLAWLSAPASVTRQLGLEGAAGASDTIVVGRVIENPDLATLQNGKPFRRQRVLVERYVRGSGPAEIVVLAPGGRYTAWIPGIGDREIEAIDGADGRLPAVGTEVLLFLRRRGDAFVIASATHGILLVKSDRRSGRKSVRVLLEGVEKSSATGRAADVNDKFAATLGLDELAHKISTLKPPGVSKADPR